MSEIRCLSPNIILNKSWHINKVDLSRGWRIIIRGQEMNYVPLPKKAKIQKEELDSCYYYNIHSGELIPCYLLVPCQKCILCKDKKAVDWATRVTCECNYHANCPWWITLTYNDLSLPDKGLMKRDVQNFMKRLRERISRVVCSDLNLRFVAVGEYGGNTARAHYHAIIYGLPPLSAKEILFHIENAWSTRVSISKWRNLPDDFKFTRNDKNGKPLYYQRLGFAYVKPAHDSTPLYLAKYMFKPEINTPYGKNPNFYLASRKNGIGYQYIVEFCKYHRQNPNVTKIDFINKHTGKMCHFTIPQYFKDYWFPTPSKLIPNDVKKAYDHLQSLVNEFNDYKEFQLNYLSLEYSFDDVPQIVNDVNEKYPFLKPIKIGLSHHDIMRMYFIDCKRSKPTDGHHIEEIFGNDVLVPNFEEYTIMTLSDYIKTNLLKTYSLIMMEYEYIMSLNFDVSEFMQCLTLRDKHKGALTQKMINKPPISLIDAVYKLKKRYEIAKSKQYN